MEMAKLLGARIVTVFGSDVAVQIAQYAIVSNVSKIVLGRTNHFTMRPMYRSELLEKLTYMAPNVDVYIIPDMKQAKRYKPTRKRRKTEDSVGRIAFDLLCITLVMVVATAFAFVLRSADFSEANIIMIYLLGVLVSSSIANKRIYALYSSLISVFLFNFFFTEPFYSLKAYDKGYPTTFLMLFIVGFLAATMTRKMKRQNLENAKNAYRTGILLENSQKLRRCKKKKDVWRQIAGQTVKLLNLSVLIYPVDERGVLEKPLLFPRRGMNQEELEQCVNDGEQGVVRWVVANHHRAGACTHTLPEARAIYLPIQDEEKVKGVMGIFLEKRRPIQEFEYGLLVAMLNETGVKLQDTFLVD